MNIIIYERHTMKLVKKDYSFIYNEGSYINKSSIDLKTSTFKIDKIKISELDFCLVKSNIGDLIGTIVTINSETYSDYLEIEVAINEDMFDFIFIPQNQRNYHYYFFQALEIDFMRYAGWSFLESGGSFVYDISAILPVKFRYSESEIAHGYISAPDNKIGFDTALRQITRNQGFYFEYSIEDDLIIIDCKFKRGEQKVIHYNEEWNVFNELTFNFPSENVNKVTVYGYNSPTIYNYTLLTNGEVRETIGFNINHPLRIQPVIEQYEYFEQFTLDTETGESRENDYDRNVYIDTLKSNDYNNEIDSNINLINSLFEYEKMIKFLNNEIIFYLKNKEDVRSSLTEFYYDLGSLTIDIKWGTSRTRMVDKLIGR